MSDKRISALDAAGALTGAELVPIVQGGQTVRTTTDQIAQSTQSALTKVDDTNVTLTLGGTPGQAVLKATSITVGWTGALALTRGGTGSGTASGARGNLGLATSTTDNAVVRFDGTTGGTQNSGVIVDDTDNATGMTSEWVSKTVTAVPPDAGGGTLSVNLHRVAADNVDAGANFILGHQNRYIFGGSTAKGGRAATYNFVANTAATNSANTNRNYVGCNNVAYTAVGDGGSDTGTGAKGAYFAASSQAFLDIGATNVFALAGEEFDTFTAAGTSLRYLTTLSLVGCNAVRGTEVDAALSIAGAGATGNFGPHAGYKNGILFTDVNTANPFYASSVLLGSYWTGAAPTIDKGIDLTGFTCTSGAFISTNFKVGQNGGLTLNNTNANIEIGSTSGANTPFIDFHSSGNAIDYDVRIIASGGTGSPGNGTLDIEASVLTTVASCTALSTTAIPAGGTAGSGYKFSSTSNFGIFFGSGAPTLSAAKGSLYLRSDGSTTNDRAYINTNGATTWTALTTVA